MIGSTGLYITFVVGWVIAFITYFSVVIVSGVQQEGKVTRYHSLQYFYLLFHLQYLLH
ncbi:hypothetical protein Alsa1_CDS0135 [Staphylococcus phage Alsa_1]|nr:hypothetical protein Alsa1_CDS0135 [Staphylococcus phage Alsa_1]